MFQIGQEVVCVIEDWPEAWADSPVKFQLRKGAIYTVAGWRSAGELLPCGWKILRDNISISIINRALEFDVKQSRLDISNLDLWPADWFRAVQRNAESVEQAMTIFRKMTETTKTPEVIGA